VTLVNTVPSAMTELIRGGALGDSVLTVNLAGEPLRGDLVSEVFARSSVMQVNNLYGPSESTTYATWSQLPRNRETEPTVGLPVAHTRAHVMDSHLGAVPSGVAGELCLSGAGLARGYHGRPGLTASRFVPMPNTDQPGARTYRTGDMARLLPSGEIRLLGRLDHQVKLRGYRIELGEIEAVLLTSPAVVQAVVLARHDLVTGMGLVAYVQRDDPDEPVDLAAFLATKLPAHMVPTHFVTMKALPLTPNGKIDRKRLPKPGTTQRTYTAPASELEHKISAVWSELLGLERVGSDDNFFALGGHSLLLVQLQRRLREELSREIAIVDLIANPTPATQAKLLSPKPESERAPRATAKAAGARRREVSARKRDEWKKRRKR
jgi:acyl-coenzyme A synthetase/AMP-(fatty) acid ligase/aryl carrier-like protein